MTVAPLVANLNDALAGRYRVERELGQGGMATVYRARDLRLDRMVAIKVFSGPGARRMEASRFEREIRIAARLTHPQIVPVHDSGEANGFPYYVMPLIEGESLRARLKREGRLSVTEAVGIASAVARAQRLPIDEGHDVVGEAMRLPRVVHWDDLWVVQPGGDADLALEAAGLHAPCPRAGEHLDRDHPVEPEVAGEVHGSHAALPQLALDTVTTGECLIEVPQGAFDLIRAIRHAAKYWYRPPSLSSSSSSTSLGTAASRSPRTPRRWC